MGLDGRFYNDIYSDINYVSEKLKDILLCKDQYAEAANQYEGNGLSRVRSGWSTQAANDRNDILNSRLLQSADEINELFSNVFNRPWGATYDETQALLCVLDDFQIQVADFAYVNTPKNFWTGIPQGTPIPIDKSSLNSSYINNVCFVAGTKVLSYEGCKEIQDIQIGDIIYSKKHTWMLQKVAKQKNILMYC